ncbi:MAG: hypothetical protein AAFP82_11115 [Bacteroidota bacterium]
MQDQELMDIWKSYDQKLEDVLSLNREIVQEITRNKFNATIVSMRFPKRMMLLIGIPYTIILYFITFIAYQAEAIFVVLGFGTISLIMSFTVISYIYHLILISQISRSQELIQMQERIAKLKISSFLTTRLAILQLPFWTICWMSLNALKATPILYGGIHLLLFLAFSYLAYWLYQQLSIENRDSRVSQFFLSGREWEPIIKSSAILEQLKAYK